MFNVPDYAYTYYYAAVHNVMCDVQINYIQFKVLVYNRSLNLNFGK